MVKAKSKKDLIERVLSDVCRDLEKLRAQTRDIVYVVSGDLDWKEVAEEHEWSV